MGCLALRWSSENGPWGIRYAVAVQQGQATQFVTDNYNLDIQWLNTISQRLLNKAVGWSEEAATLTVAGGTQNASIAAELNTMTSLALHMAGTAPSSRPASLTATIDNGYEGCQTQVTVGADGSGSIHDIADSPWSYVEEVASIVINVAAMFCPALVPLAVAIDAAQAGQNFANGQYLQGLLSMAQAVGVGLGGAAAGIQNEALALAAQGEAIGAADAVAVMHGIETADSLATASQVVTAASQVVGGAYGVVTSAESGNGFGILAGVLEAAAGAATGIGMSSGDAAFRAEMTTLAQDVGTAGIAAGMAGAFASGNIVGGLIDSLNLYLPAVAQTFVTDQNNLTSVGNGLADDLIAIDNAYAQAYANYDAAAAAGIIDRVAQGLGTAILNTSGAAGQPSGAPLQFGASINTAVLAANVGGTQGNAIPDFSNAVCGWSSTAQLANSVSELVTCEGETYRLTIAPGASTDTVVVMANPVGAAYQSPDAQVPLSLFQRGLDWGKTVLSFAGYAANELFGIPSAGATEPISQEKANTIADYLDARAGDGSTEGCAKVLNVAFQQVTANPHVALAKDYGDTLLALGYTRVIDSAKDAPLNDTYTPQKNDIAVIWPTTKTTSQAGHVDVWDVSANFTGWVSDYKQQNYHNDVTNAAGKFMSPVPGNPTGAWANAHYEIFRHY